MTLITPGSDFAELEELLSTTKQSVADARRDIEDLRKQIRSGGETSLTESSKQLGSIETWLKNCMKLEMSLVELRNRQSGIAQGGYALDLDRARSEIGCRLARLRTAGCQRRVSK